MVESVMDNKLKIKEIVSKFEIAYNAKVVYVSLYGSKLFGTDNEKSDSDYKGIFIPSQKDVLLKKDIEHYNYNTNTKTKNDKDDVDLQLYSIYKWFNLLKKGETGALDLLFSMFREDTQMYKDTSFIEVIKDNYTKFYNKNLHSFIGYCVGQSKMYNVRGQRFAELDDFIKVFTQIKIEDPNAKLEEYLPKIKDMFLQKEYKYIKVIKAQISRGNEAYKEGYYVELLGKRFASSVTIGYFAKSISLMAKQFGHRTRSASKGVDYKALSHAVRVINEVEELLDDAFITFPLKNRDYIKSIKEGKVELSEVMDYIDKKLDIVQKKLEDSTLPLKSDEVFIDNLILSLVRREDKADNKG